MGAAERQLLDAAHRTEVASKIAAITGYFASLLASAEARIVAHVQGRIALIDPSLPPVQRFAAIERLHAEQAAALARLQLDIGQERRQSRRSGIGTLVAGHRTRRRALSHRHIAARAALTLMIGVRPALVPTGNRKRPSVRRLAMHMATRARRHAGGGPGTR